MAGVTRESEERIRQEEQLRARVRLELQSEQKALPTSLWTFFNSHFGVWLLSALFLSGAGWLYAWWQAQEQQTTYLEHLRREVSHRFSFTLVRLWELSDKTDPHRLDIGRTPDDVKAVLANFATGIGHVVAPLYPEFVDMSTMVLLTELAGREAATGNTLNPNPRLDDLRQAVEDISGLLVLMDGEKASLSDPAAVASTLHKTFAVLRGSEFYFSDCGVDNPFC